MAVTLTLGSVVFSGFEIPESIATGGEQALVAHKLPGGARIVDAMGADHHDVGWSGRFRGASAEARARQLDGYRIGGRQFILTWSAFRYRVIVRSFEAQYQQPFEIPYSISCLVVSDESAPVLTGVPGIDELIGSDLGAALGLSNSLGVSQAASAVAIAQQAITSVGTLKNADVSTLAQIAGTVGAAQQVVGATISGAEAAVGTATPIVAGGNPSAMASSLTGQSAGFGQISRLYQLSSTLTRMGKNLAA